MFKFIIRSKEGVVLRKVQYETEELGQEWIDQAFARGLLGKEYDVETIEVVPDKEKMCDGELLELNHELLYAIAEKEEGNLVPMEAYVKKRKEIKKKYE